ncbi:MAG: leucine-rich repeat domain-containing protein [Treponema sp.]|nr:leucine-rich repeat domain-containing protein [Treponema sp.]
MKTSKQFTFTCLLAIVALFCLFTFVFISCYERTNNELDSMLKELPANTADNPHIIKLDVSSLEGFGLAFQANWGKYVYLDLSDSTFTSIGKSAFYTRDNLTGLSIPNSVTKIWYEAFAHCTSLTDITIPNSVTDIGYGPFSACTSLMSISVADDNPAYSSADGILYNKDKTALLQCPGGKTGTVNIPNSVTSIERGAFMGCVSLTGITIPDSVTSIEGEVFYACTSLVSISVAGGNTVYSSVDGMLYNKDKSVLLQCPEGKTTVIIPDSVTNIEERAFLGCTNLVNIIIPNSVISIGEEAFKDCNKLADVIIGNSVTSIGKHTFDGCNSLANVTIGNSVTSIGAYAFFGCTSLANVTIGNSVENIRYGAFDYTGLTNITIPDSVISLENRAFYSENLVRVTFEGTIPSSGFYFYSNIRSTLSPFRGDLRDKYFAANGGPGMYTRAPPNTVWTKQ